MALCDLLAKALPLMAARFGMTATDPCTLFFSICDGSSRSHIIRGAGASFERAWEDGVTACQAEAQRHKLYVRWLRIDRVVQVQRSTWGELAIRLGATKRNYFRLGLALDPDLQVAFLAQELNANAMLYLGSNHVEAGINEKNFSRYTRRRFGHEVGPDFSPQCSIYLFRHEGLFLSGDESLFALPKGRSPVWLPAPSDVDARWRDPTVLNAGRRQVDVLNSEQVYALIDSGANYLASQVKEGGQFTYGHFPCFGREIPAYNNLRHASSIYSMLEAWELTRNDALLDAIRLALAYLTDTIIRLYPQRDGTVLAYNVDANDEIKLGANAVSLLALVKYDELTGDTQHRPLMDALALGIARMQDPDTGQFVHVLNADDLTLKEAFRIVYYDGEAAFGLMRFYGLTADTRWLAIVERAFDYFIQADYWKHHDHWLSYCANELTLHKAEERYFRFGVQNIESYLDFILGRETTYPTLLELAMAFDAMRHRIHHEHPEMLPVLENLDVEKFHRALHHRAHYLLNGFFWPELAMYFAKPSLIVGSFFIRHHSFRVRIDDVEHYLSGYVAYWKMLKRNQSLGAVEPAGSSLSVTSTTVPHGEDDDFPPAMRSRPANWDAAMLAEATRGKWWRAPQPGWLATGVSLSAAPFQPGNIVAARAPSAEQRIGVMINAIAKMPFRPQGLIVEETGASAAAEAFDGPILSVREMGSALISLGHYSRQQFKGTVIGVTGSAGKTTTCAMLASMLRPWGEVGATRLSANTSRGIAWNLASIPWSSRYMVLEMAIAGMARSSAMTRPNIAVVTNIGPAHLQYHHSTETIARRKSAIFDGMAAGGIAIINMDTLHADVLIKAATDRGLRIVGYGEHAASTLRLTGYDKDSGLASVSVENARFSFIGRSRHLTLNALACAAVAHALGMDLSHALRQLEMFEPLAGRGACFSIIDEGRRIRIVDESYNANPLSMIAALEDFGRMRKHGTGALLLGDMLELDDKSAELHQDLVPLIVAVRPRIVVLVGDSMKEVATMLTSGSLIVQWHDSAAAAWQGLKSVLDEDDIVMVKGSNSTGLYALLRKLEAPSSNIHRSQRGVS